MDPVREGPHSLDPAWGEADTHALNKQTLGGRLALLLKWYVYNSQAGWHYVHKMPGPGRRSEVGQALHKRGLWKQA